jgi:hypothetical protein
LLTIQGKFVCLRASLNNFPVNGINLVPKMGQIIKIQRSVSSASITGLYVILEAAFTIALLGVLLYNSIYKYGLFNSFLSSCKPLT